EAAAQLGRDEARRRRVFRQQLEHDLAVAHAAAGRDLAAEHGLAAVVVQERYELEASPLPRIAQRPTREAAGNFGDVFLRVAAVDAERVQLHQLPGVVLVEAARLLARLC